MRQWIGAIAVLVLVLAAAPAWADGVLATLTVLGPRGAVARAVVDGTACPAIEIDGKRAAMNVRIMGDSRFPLICDAALPAGAAKARIGDRDLPVPKREVRRIALFGDSGCRVDGHEFQPCNDPAQWPFARTSASAAALQPDLVIHVGDYLYRERPCPPVKPGCSGTPSGDDWPAWQADFFAPAATLLAAAPWVMVRGNHENCERAGDGFFRLLDPRPYPIKCPRISPVYRVEAKPLALYVLDSGEANDTETPAPLVARYRREFASIHAPQGAWLLSHRPVWATVSIGNMLGVTVVVNDNATLEAASANKLPTGIALVLSGHIHRFEALSFTDRRPPQLVLGTAGSSLDRGADVEVTGHEIGGTTIAYGRTLQAFGVTTMERSGAGWAATLHDEDGNPRFTCTITGPEIACAP
ncbi:MAG TPA: metallophosphoesterase [Stellaceae bacterium]|nr:metallophosphoesterase [Stellaceae bacterium]